MSFRIAATGFAALLLLGAAAPPGLSDGVAAYTPQAVALIDAARDGAELLQQRIAAGDAPGAQAAWLRAHAAWEQAETFTATLYPDLDDAIDAWPDGKAGFHSIEPRLFAGELGPTRPAADGLAAALRDFSARIRTQGLTAQGLFEGSAGLAFETGEHKAAGGESVASNSSYDDMRNNVRGVHAVFVTVIAPALQTRDPARFRTAQAQLARMEALLQAPDLKSLDQTAYGKAAEGFAATLADAAPGLGLQPLKLGD